MDVLKIIGGQPLDGRVQIDGAKNSALPIMAATLAVSGTSHLKAIPDLVDVKTMELLLQELGVRVERNSNYLQISSEQSTGFKADWELMRRMRAGICVLGPLLARFGRAVVSLPGGCNIGHRPVDLHLQGLAALGADMRIKQGFVVAECDQLRGSEIDLAGPSGSTVTGTCNVMVAASLAVGKTLIQNAAQEPEVVDLGRYLNACGASIMGLGTSTLEITGTEQLQGQSYQIIPDRIEAATFAIAAAATRSKMTLGGCRADHMTAVLDTLRQMGANVEIRHGDIADELTIDGTGPLVGVDVVATPYPGIPTDTQAQLMALQTTIEGTTRITDTVFPDRILHASELMRMGASIIREESQMVVHGGRRLSGAHVMASDLRASAALVIAALTAEGETVVHRIYHLDRGYSQLESKLRGLNANVRRDRDF
ncbi:MAG: UDP-N-acetylglucosamine 1-carboxyvinyltransferase [Fuerstiella sp.]